MEHFKPKSRSNLSLLWRDRPPNNCNLTSFASPNHDFEVFIDNQVLNLSLQASQNAAPHETIGLLAGRVCQDARGSYTVILAMEAAKDNEIEATPIDVHISSKSYAQLRSRLELNYPVLETVGWFHSHPLSSPILSEEDIVEQSTWTDRNHVALVVSLTGRTEVFGVFYGPEAFPLFGPLPYPATGA